MNNIVAHGFIANEYQECVAFREWMDFHRLMYSHIPNNTFSGYYRGQKAYKNVNQLRKLYALGVHRGVPDYIIITPKALLFVEMKKKGGRVTEDQAKWIEALNGINREIKVAACCGKEDAMNLTVPINRGNIAAAICCGADEAIEFVSKFL